MKFNSAYLRPCAWGRVKRKTVKRTTGPVEREITRMENDSVSPRTKDDRGWKQVLEAEPINDWHRLSVLVFGSIEGVREQVFRSRGEYATLGAGNKKFPSRHCTNAWPEWK